MFGLLQFSLKLPLIRLSYIKVNREMVYWTLQLSLVVLTMVVIVIDGSFRLNVSLGDVYLRRLEARDDVGAGSLAAYAITTLSYALAPTALLLGYTRRHYSVVAMALLAFLCLYSYRATKTDLFMPFFLLGVCIMLKSTKCSFGPAVVLAATALVLLSIFEVLALDTSVLSGYFVRRQLMIPSLLTSYYWDFFSDQPLMLFTDKFYGRYFNPPQYNLSLVRLIGYEYFGSAETNANTCFWASAFANLGYAGMPLFTILLGFVLRLMDSVAINGDELTACAMAALFGIQLSNGSLESCMITGGVAISLVTLYCLRSDCQTNHRNLQCELSAWRGREITKTWTH